MNKKIETEKYIEDIANHLFNPRIYGKATVMVGAGFSKNAISYSNSNMPDWGELSKTIFSKVYPCPKEKTSQEYKKWEEKQIWKTSGSNVLKLAEEYSVVFGHGSLDQLISNAINDNSYIPSSLHQKLLSLPWNDVFTTNYDTLLERTCQLIKNSKYKIVNLFKNLPNSIQPRIIKLHGCVTTNGPYIITEEDYRTYPYQYAPFVNTVQQAMIETLLCMIGFSGDDPNFLSWLGWLRDNMGDYCPKMYLCGIFDNLAEAEIEFFKHKNVILVDLSCFIKDENDNNKYYNAYKQFFEVINNYDKSLNSNIIPLTFSMNMKELSEKLKLDNDIINQYIILTNKLAKNLRNYTHENLFSILNTENINLPMLQDMLYRMKKCYEPIYDEEAYKLKDVFKMDNINSDLKILIGLFLCRMYRMDGNLEEYKKYIKELENIRDIQKYEIYIEKSKYYLWILDYEKGIKELDKIPNSIGDTLIILKKAGLLHLFGDNIQAGDILKQVSNKVSQLNLPNNDYIFYDSYINLLWRTLWWHVKNDKENYPYKNNYLKQDYSILEQFNNYKYEMLELSSPVEKSSTIEKNFNPNSYTIHTNIGKTNEDRLTEICFNYLLFIDEYCLPYYSDHENSLKKAVDNVSKLSTYKSWYLSMMIRTNNKKQYNNNITRKFLLNIDNEEIKLIFENIHSILKKYLYEEFSKYRDNRYFIEFKNLLDVFSRLAIAVPFSHYKDTFTMLINMKEYNYKWSDMSKIVKTISYYLSENDLISYIDNIMNDTDRLLPFYQNKILTKNNDIEWNKYLPNLLHNIKSSKEDIRENAITKLFFIQHQEIIKDNLNDIEDAIWSVKNSEGLPKGKNVYIYAWENFSHNHKEEYINIVKNYINLASWSNYREKPRQMTEDNHQNELEKYLFTLEHFSKLNPTSNINLDISKEWLLTILNNCIEYIYSVDLPWSLSFSDTKVIKDKIKYMIIICSIICTEYIINNQEDLKDISIKIEELFKLLNDVDIEKSALFIICEYCKNNEFDINLIIEENLDEFSASYYFGISNLLLLSENKKYSKKNINDKVYFTVKSLPYIYNNIDILCTIPNLLYIVIYREWFYQMGNMEIFSNNLHKMYTLTINNFNEERILNFYYNLSKLIATYKKAIIEKKLDIPEQLNKLITDMKDLNLPEISNSFNEIN